MKHSECSRLSWAFRRERIVFLDHFSASSSANVRANRMVKREWRKKNFRSCPSTRVSIAPIHRYNPSTMSLAFSLPFLASFHHPMSLWSFDIEQTLDLIPILFQVNYLRTSYVYLLILGSLSVKRRKKKRKRHCPEASWFFFLCQFFCSFRTRGLSGDRLLSTNG